MLLKLCCDAFINFNVPTQITLTLCCLALFAHTVVTKTISEVVTGMNVADVRTIAMTVGRAHSKMKMAIATR